MNELSSAHSGGPVSVPQRFARGLVIDEGIENEGVLKMLAPYLSNRYPFRLGASASVHISVLEVPRETLFQILFNIASHLLPTKYYAHFILDEILYVIFPGTICTVRRDDHTAAERCRTIGKLFMIPIEQMPFEQLFEQDHPGGI